MTKDRLAALKAAQTYEVDVFVTIEEGGGYLQDFFKEAELIFENLEELKTNVEEVGQIHSSILSAPKTDDKFKQQLEDLMADIKRTAIKVREKLKVIEKSIEQLEKTSPMRAAFRIKKTQHSMLLQKFVEVMSDYNKTQIDYRKKFKARIQRQLEITGRSTNNEELEEMLERDHLKHQHQYWRWCFRWSLLESGDPAIFTQGIITDTKQAKQMLADIEARHADFIKLENSIRELHDMFIDMALLVENQGEKIDRIETYLDGIDIETPKLDIKKCRKFQRKSRRKQILIIICIIVLVIVLISVVGGILGLN